MKLNKKNSLETDKSNDYWLPFFRISISVFAILQILSFWKDIPNIFLENSYVKPEIFDSMLDNYSPTIFDIHSLLTKYVFFLNYDSLVYIVIITYLFFLLLLSVGFLIRISAIIGFLLQIIIFKSIHLYLYGADFFLSMSLFYCIIFPIKEYSIDNLFFIKKPVNEISNKWSLILIQLHVSIIYFFSGLDKGIGINWYNGESVWKAVSSHNYNGIINLIDYNIPPFVFAVIGVLTVIVEFFYPVFINIKKTRKLWLTFTIGMHLSIIVFMGLYFFGTIMIILNLSAYYFPFQVKNKEILSKQKADLGILIQVVRD